MKTIVVYFSLLLTMVSFSYGQQKSAGNAETMIDLYFKSYSGESKYQINTMGEAMVKRTNEMGMWTHPSIARIMKQVKTYKYLNFNSSSENLQKIIAQVSTAVNKGNIYKEYFRWETNDVVSSVIYTKGDKKITELDYITLNKGHISVSCFIGDNIDMESIRSLVANK
ncbi:hypothetical protein ACFSR6_02640 [Pedobacter vanadiisoli]|uniref:DUF4252 domain-containing protein n=1 Tax=Pedobacter vanadiisoli TaxID=1761975 RepID=A0ABW5MFX9_9SPHI